MSEIDGSEAGNRAQRRAASRRSKKMMAVSSGAVLVAGVAGPGVLLSQSVASAATTFTVENLDDAGPGSLRQAIEDAEANAGEDVITFATGLTGTITLESDFDTMQETVDILGPGADVLTVDGDGNTTFQFEGQSAGVISISGLTVTGSYGELGGAIGLYSAGAALEVTDMVITGNTAGDEGGGIGVDTDGEGAAPSVTIANTEISGNTADGGGGAVYFDAESSDESFLTVTNSTITGNEAGGGGGGFYTEDVTVEVIGSTISGNTAGDSGGGLYLSRGPVTIESSVISGNTSDGNGGGFYINGSDPFTMESSTVADNTADGGGGGVYIDQGTFTMRNSTVSGNTAGSYGGGLYLSGTAVIENSTISGNTASQAGGIYGSYGGLTIVQSTITDNEAISPSSEPAVGGVQLIGLGDLIGTAKSAAAKSVKPDKGSTASRPAAATPGQLEVVGTIIAGNVGQDVGVYAEAEATVTSDHSILGVVDPMVEVTDVGGTQLDVTDPGLDALASNGGPTQTHALLDGSVALNAGPDPVPSFPGNEYDQRGPGFARVAFGFVDVGAFEAQEDEPVVPPAPEPDAGPADAILVTPAFTG